METTRVKGGSPWGLQKQASKITQRSFLIAFVGGWAGAVLAGTVLLTDYSNRPGDVAAISTKHWPIHSTLERSTTQQTLLVFLHPKCPCSRSTLRQLERLQSECQGLLQTQFLFFCPTEKTVQWTQDHLWTMAQRLTEHPLVIDRNGVEANLFGATTSGHIALFSPAGRLLYAGGITSSRGHEGDNRGSEILLQLIHGKSLGKISLPVFGCSIQDNRCQKIRHCTGGLL